MEDEFVGPRQTIETGKSQKQIVSEMEAPGGGAVPEKSAPLPWYMLKNLPPLKPGEKIMERPRDPGKPLTRTDVHVAEAEASAVLPAGQIYFGFDCGFDKDQSVIVAFKDGRIVDVERDE